MKVLITGGLGYVGGRLAGYCMKKDPELDIVLTTRGNRKFFPGWAKDFTVVPMELLDERSIKGCIEKEKPDYIVHLAALNEADSAADPELADQVNHRGAEQISHIASMNDVKKFVYFSTFHVYGMGGVTIITEDTPTVPLCSYAITHLAAEKAVMSFDGRGMDAFILRASNGYGYPMDIGINRWTLVVNDLCRQAIVNGRIVLKSFGEQYRDFISLRDIARATYHFLFVMPGAGESSIYNLGGDKVMSILEMAQKVSEIYLNRHGKKIKVERNISAKGAEHEKSFKYCIEKMLGTGFKLEGNMDSEIDATMKICEEFLR